MNISFPFWGKIRSTRKIIYSFTVAEDAPAAAWWERPAGRGASWRIVLNGKPADTMSFPNFWSSSRPVLSRDGTYLAYAADSEPESTDSGRKRDTGSPATFDHDAFGQGCGRFHAASRCMSAEAGSIRSGPLLAAAPGPAAMAPGSARFGERQARLGLHQIDELAYAKVFLQFRVLSVTNVSSVIRIE